MELIKAAPEHFNTVKSIVTETIKKQYPLYYPKGAVEFFLSHHCDENIKRDIEDGIVYILEDGGEYVGTGTARQNELCRLFVLPEYQGRGYGTAIMDELEKQIFEAFDEITLDASLSAYNMYVHRGYHSAEYHMYETPSGDFLCYHVMRKPKP